MSLASLLMPEGEFRVIRCEIADKLIQCGDGDAALLYLYIIRHGNRFQETQAMRDLRLSKERFERAVFTLTNLAIAQSPTATEITPSPAPRYTASELRAARADDHRFRAVCDTAESILGRPLTEHIPAGGEHEQRKCEQRCQYELLSHSRPSSYRRTSL